MKPIIRTVTTVFSVVAILVLNSVTPAKSASIFNSTPTTVAFPGAEGFGANSLGGRGGKIYKVTNLHDSGAGSLRACVQAKGARTCIFRTGGLIQLQSPLVILNPYITIAGQTAPGGGITLKKTNGGDALIIKTHDVILRYITSRPGPGGENHGAQAASDGVHLYNIIIDHCSFSWATDEVLETWYKVTDTSIQWSIVSEGLDCSTHHKGCHSMGLMVGGYADSESKTELGSENISVHHNLFAHNGERNPLIQTSGLVDVVNNVAYNPFGTFMYLYMKSNSIVPVNYVGNFFKYGPNTEKGKYEIKSYDDGGLGASIYVSGNIGPHRTSDALSNDIVVDSGSRKYLTPTRHEAPPVTTTSALNAYKQVLAQAGNNAGLNCDGTWFNRRDRIDKRVVSDTANGTGSIINNPSQVDGWVTPATGKACTDSDHDGMPDTWEIKVGLNPNNPSDANADSDNDGYTNIEEYLNSPRKSKPKNRLINGGFNSYLGDSKIPKRWKAIQFSTSDGKASQVKWEGSASVKIIGAPGTQKILLQTLPITGSGGKSLTFSFWVKGRDIPKTTLCRGIVTLYKNGVVVKKQILKCPTGTFKFKKLSKTFTAPGSFDKIQTQFVVNSSGTVWFDKVRLMK